MAAISHNWKNGAPKSKKAVSAQVLVQHTLKLIQEHGPRFWVLENPRGMLRKMSFMAPYQRKTVSYCQYGEDRMKPTDLWGRHPPSLILKPICSKSWDVVNPPKVSP